MTPLRPTPVVVAPVVVKVQKPLASSDANPPWFVYDAATRDHKCLIPEKDIPPHVRAHMQNLFKAYFLGTWADGKWTIGEPLP
jgi:hypothetical protein